MVFRLIGSEALNSVPYVEMKSKVAQDSEAPIVLLFPGIEGFGTVYQDLTKQINARTVAVQLNLEDDQKTIVEIAQSVLPVSLPFLSRFNCEKMALSFRPSKSFYPIMNLLSWRIPTGRWWPWKLSVF